jgi:hypothetical protein
LRAYQIEVDGRLRFATSAGQAATVRRELGQTLGRPRGYGEIEEIELPGSRATVEWVNELMERVDARNTAFPDAP